MSTEQRNVCNLSIYCWKRFHSLEINKSENIPYMQALN